MDRYNVHSLPKSADGTYLCPLCQRNFFSEKCGRHYCPGCGLRITIEAPTQAEQVQALVAGTDWDKKCDGGSMNSFVTTTLAGILRPRSFFAEVARGNKMFAAFTYSYWMQVLMTFAVLIFLILLAPLLQFASPIALATPTVAGWIVYMGVPAALIWIAVGIIFVVLTLLCLLVNVALSLLMGAAIVHVLLFIVGGAKQPFYATFRAVAYMSSVTLLALIPLVNIIACFYIFWVLLVALSRAHSISWFRVLLSWCLPFVLLAAAIFGFRNFVP